VQTAIKPNRQDEPFAIPGWLALCLFLAIAAFFLWEEHRAHILGALPYALLMLCPIIHLFMHRGHGGHGADRSGHEGHDHDDHPKGAVS
jgi:hypothetical protein